MTRVVWNKHKLSFWYKRMWWYSYFGVEGSLLDTVYGSYVSKDILKAVNENGVSEEQEYLKREYVCLYWCV